MRLWPKREKRPKPIRIGYRRRRGWNNWSKPGRSYKNVRRNKRPKARTPPKPRFIPWSRTPSCSRRKTPRTFGPRTNPRYWPTRCGSSWPTRCIRRVKPSRWPVCWTGRKPWGRSTRPYSTQAISARASSAPRPIERSSYCALRDKVWAMTGTNSRINSFPRAGSSMWPKRTPTAVRTSEC